MTSATVHSHAAGSEAGEWGPLLRGERRAGRLLARLSAASAATALLGGAVAAPLALAHIWRPVVALPVLLVVLAVAVRASRAVQARPMPPWSLVLVLLIAVGAGVWAGSTHAEHVVLRRDAGSYALYGQQLASAHQVPVDVNVRALGGPAVVDDPDVTVGSPGFYQQGRGTATKVVPQFLIGVPAWLSVGMWVGGWTGLFLVPAVFLALGIASLGALTAATIGPRWAPLVAAAVAVTAPVLHAARSTYSEPAALLALSAALTLLATATERASGRIALFAGLLLGGAGLVRLDALREVVLVIPVVVLLATRRHPAARPLVIGAGASTAFCLLVDLVLDRPYLRLLAGSLLPLFALAAVVTGAGLLVLRRSRGPAPRWWTRLVPAVPGVLAALVLLAGVALATRPWWMTSHTTQHDPSKGTVRVLQSAQGLSGDGTQTYAEHSLTWVGWWVGWTALALALAGAVLAAYRLGVVVGRVRALVAWVGPVRRRPGLAPPGPLPAGHHARPPVGRPPARGVGAAGGPAAGHGGHRGPRPAGPPARAAARPRPGRRGRCGGAGRPGVVGDLADPAPADRAGRGGSGARRLPVVPARRRRGRGGRTGRERVAAGAEGHLLGAHDGRAGAAHLDPDRGRSAGSGRRARPGAPGGPGRRAARGAGQRPR